MFSRLLLKLCWHLLLIATLGLLGLSVWIPYRVFSDAFLVPVLPVIAAAALLSVRVLAAFHRYLHRRRVLSPPLTVTVPAAALRWALPLLSIACSLVWFEALFEPPDTETLHRLDRADLQHQYQARIAAEEARFWRRREAALSELAARYRTLADGVDARRLPGIRELERQLDLVLKQPNAESLARGFEARLEAERGRHGRELAALQAERRAEVLSLEVATDKARDTAMRELLMARQAALDRIGRADYSRDPRLSPVFVDRLEAMIRAFSEQLPSPRQLALGLALFSSLMLELAVWMAVQHLVLAFGPLLAADYGRRLHLMQHRMEIENELQAARLDERLLRRRVENVREGLEKRMRRAVDEIVS